MADLEDEWSRMISFALDSARKSGKHDVADYLSLRAANDAIRRAGVGWLIDTLARLASNVRHAESFISFDRIDPYSFTFLGSNIVGICLEMRHGVRCLTVEAGWTRTPADGFMKGGALAIGRISHFGMPKANVDIALARDGDQVDWFVFVEGRMIVRFDESDIRHHLNLFLG